MFSDRNFQVSAIPGIVLPLKAQCPWLRPYQQRYFPVYVLSLIQRLRVVTNASATFRAFRGTIIKDVFARLFIMTNDIRFATGHFQFIERPQVLVLASSFAWTSSIRSLMAAHVFLKTDFQNTKQLFTLFGYRFFSLTSSTSGAPVFMVIASRVSCLLFCCASPHRRASGLFFRALLDPQVPCGA